MIHQKIRRNGKEERKMKRAAGGATAAKGYEAASVAAGIKYKDRTDMALIYSQVPCEAAGTFTTNVVKAAPVKWDRQVIDSGAKVQAIVVNSGIANACTGKEGFGYCKETADAAARALSIPADGVMVGSTGVIGMQLPIEKLTAGIEALAEKKSSGMIHPNMCTMLAFITTDAAIGKEALQKALSEDMEDTYNMISVDGDTSTNDTVLLLANGLAGNPEIVYGSREYEEFKAALHEVNEYLAKKIAGDGEGATALFEVKMTGCESVSQAKMLAKSVACSNLTKTTIAGHDANWGRILCAMGYSGAQFDPEKVDLFFESTAGKIQIIENGTAVDYSEEEATKILSCKEVTAIADIKMGTECATAWGCDLTHGYIDINADYRS